MTDGKALRIGLVGYGEVGKILGRALVERRVAWVGTWDRLLRDPAQGPAMRAHALDAGIEPAALLAALLAPLGFSMEVVADRVGVASAIKMCRSVMIKGLEAIVVESFTTARRYGVEEHVLASLQETFPTIDWERQGAYLFSRVAQHGKRRAEEMREVAVTVREVGLDPHMAAATAERQDWMAGLKTAAGRSEVAKDADWREYADRLLRCLERAPRDA